MKSQEAAQRYAKALFELATEKKVVDDVLNELRSFVNAVKKDEEIHSFFMGPAITAEAQRLVLEKTFEKKSLSNEMRGLLHVLVSKRRMTLLEGISSAFQAEVDHSRDVARGQASSATTLFPEERQMLETTISRYTGKKAVLEYHEDKSLLGGLVARVGSYTFDDSLDTQLRLMKEALKKRRAN